MNIQVIRAALCLSGLTLVLQANAAEPVLPKEGWASWQVEAVENAPAWCCWSSWDGRDTSRKTCKLDEDHGGFGSRDNAKTDAVRVYARVSGGKIERLRVLSADCLVEAKTPIQDLGNVATDDSSRYLITLTRSLDPGNSEDLYESVLMGLATHRGDIAQNALTGMARGDSRLETRKKAVFWLTQLRGEPGAEVAASLMFSDKDAEVRQHAAFAIAQTKSPRVSADLIRQGNTDKDAEVRAQAWFWLAQTGAPGAEDAIVAALRKDQDDHVREQAIFALSQLPDERGTSALIKAAEDRTLSAAQRKQAVFWLAQSESEGAEIYLENALVEPTAR